MVLLYQAFDQHSSNHASPVQVRWFAEIFSQHFSSNMFSLLEANSESDAEEAKIKLDQGLRVCNTQTELAKSSCLTKKAGLYLLSLWC